MSKTKQREVDDHIQDTSKVYAVYKTQDLTGRKNVIKRVQINETSIGKNSFKKLIKHRRRL